MCKSWCQPFNLGAHHYFDFKGHGSWVEFLAASCFIFVCLFVFHLPRWVIILFLSLTSGWGFLFFFFLFFFLFCFVFCFCLFVFCFCFLFCVVFPSKCSIPHHISRVRLIFFFFVSPVGKVFCFFFLFLFGFILFCFVLFLLPKIPPPPDIKWCALILILLHRWWWTPRHRQFWIPMHFCEKSNSNLKLH